MNQSVRKLVRAHGMNNYKREEKHGKNAIRESRFKNAFHADEYEQDPIQASPCHCSSHEPRLSLPQ
jgi:hypothetical protein